MCIYYEPNNVDYINLRIECYRNRNYSCDSSNVYNFYDIYLQIVQDLLFLYKLTKEIDYLIEVIKMCKSVYILYIIILAFQNLGVDLYTDLVKSYLSEKHEEADIEKITKVIDGEALKSLNHNDIKMYIIFNVIYYRNTHYTHSLVGCSNFDTTIKQATYIITYNKIVFLEIIQNLQLVVVMINLL